jgi:hypothetical protein
MVAENPLDPRSQKPPPVQTWMKTDGKTVVLPNNQLPPPGSVPFSHGTRQERDRKRVKEKTPELEGLAAQNPEAVYRDGWRMNDDGTLYKDAYGSAVPLKQFWQVAGKRTAHRELVTLGELRDDALELQELLVDPEVVESFRKLEAEDPTVVGKLLESTENRVKKFMQERGLGADSKPYLAIIRMQRLASEERKTFMGTAVTVTELRSALAWMPSAGDNYGAMLNKNNFLVHESNQGFTRWLDVYKDQANMSHYYDAFGMSRFDEASTPAPAPAAPLLSEMSDEQLKEELGL